MFGLLEDLMKLLLKSRGGTEQCVQLKRRQMKDTKVMKDKQGTPEENMGTDAYRNSLDST